MKMRKLVAADKPKLYGEKRKPDVVTEYLPIGKKTYPGTKPGAADAAVAAAEIDDDASDDDDNDASQKKIRELNNDGNCATQTTLKELAPSAREVVEQTISRIYRESVRIFVLGDCARILRDPS